MIDSLLESANDLIGKFVPDQTKQQEFKAELKKLEVADRMNARDLHAKRLQSKDPLIRRIVPIIAICIMLFYFLMIAGLYFVEIPEANQALINVALGIIGTGLFGGVVGFYFGNSQKQNN